MYSSVITTGYEPSALTSAHKRAKRCRREQSEEHYASGYREEDTPPSYDEATADAEYCFMAKNEDRSSKSSVPHFYDGLPYKEWAYKMQAFLVRKGLHQVVRDRPREDPEDISQGSPATPEDGSVGTSEKCASYIILALPSEKLQIIRHVDILEENAAAKMWWLLKDHFDRQDPESLARKLMRYRNTSKDPQENMSNYLLSGRLLVQELNDAGNAVTELDLCITLLIGIKEEWYAVTIEMLLNESHNQLTFDHIRDKLLAREQRSRDEPSQGMELAFTSVECWHCHKTGHIRRNCPKLEQAKDARPKRRQPRSRRKPRKHEVVFLAESDSGDSSSEDSITEFIVSDDTDSVWGDSSEEDYPSNYSIEESESEIDTPTRSHYSSDLTDVARRSESGQEFIIDSGATSHFVGRTNQVPSQGRTLTITTTGSDVQGYRLENEIHMMTKAGDPIALKEAICVDKEDTHLLSVSKITDTGCTVTFTRNRVRIVNSTGQEVLAGRRNGNLFQVTLFHREAARLGNDSKQGQSLRRWHERLGHLGLSTLKRACLGSKNKPQALKGIQINDEKDDFTCRGCAEGKQTKGRYKSSSRKSEKPIELLHADLGVINFASAGGYRYALVMVDDYSGWTITVPLRQKNDAAQAMIAEIRRLQRKFSTGVKTLRCDKGGEFTSNQLARFCREEGIQQQFSCTQTPEQNGKAERTIRTVVEMMRCMMTASNIPQKYWPLVLAAATYTKNRCPSRVLGGRTPYEHWEGSCPDVSNLRTIGCTAYVLKKQGHRKLDAKTTTGVMMGYSSESKGYIILGPLDKIVVSNDVTFDEDAMPWKGANENEYSGPNQPPAPDDSGSDNSSDGESADEPIPETGDEDDIADITGLGAEKDADGGIRRSTRERKPPQYWMVSKEQTYMTKNPERVISAEGVIEPAKYEEAMSSPEKDE